MKLRILETVREDGSRRYRVQRRWLGFWWLTCTTAGEGCTYVLDYSSLDDAKAALRDLWSRRRRNVVQQNIICGGDVCAGDIHREAKP